MPPQSPRDFSAGVGAGPADVGWARVLFCDVYVALPTPDLQSKLSARTAKGVNLGWDKRRRAFIVFVPSLMRISTFKVFDWLGENQFEGVRTIRRDTPVSYNLVDDFQVGAVT